MGMTNHIPGDHFCIGSGSLSNPGLANHVINSLYIGHGDDDMNDLLCKSGVYSKNSNMDEEPAGIRQYDGAFYLDNTRWTNFTTIACKCFNIPGFRDCQIKSLPYSLVAGRQKDCNGKFPIQLHNSWPLGASEDDSANSAWAWASGGNQTQNLVSLTGTSSCSYHLGGNTNGVTGGVIDMTGTLGGPAHKAEAKVSYHATPIPNYQNPGELAEIQKDILEQGGAPYRYAVIASTQDSKVPSAGWSYTTFGPGLQEYECSYCFYDRPGSCHVQNVTTLI